MSNQLPEELLIKIGEDIDSVVEEAVTTATANDVFTSQIANNLTFFGKTLAAWEDILGVPIPDDKPLDTDTLQELYIQLAKKIQIASHYYSIASATHTVSATGVAIKKADLITALIAYHQEQNNKLPPSTVLEKMAESYLTKLTNVSTISKVVRDFWKEKLTTLDKIKSILSSVAMAQATEMKYSSE